MKCADAADGYYYTVCITELTHARKHSYIFLQRGVPYTWHTAHCWHGNMCHGGRELYAANHREKPITPSDDMCTP